MKLKKSHKNLKTENDSLWWVWLLLSPIIITIPLALAWLVCYGMYNLFNLIKEPIETLIYIGGIILGITIAGGIIWFFFWVYKQYYEKALGEGKKKLKAAAQATALTVFFFIVVIVIIVAIGSFLDSCHRFIPPFKN